MSTPLFVRIRPATASDVPLILALFRRAAAFQGEPPDVVTATEERLAATMFGPAPLASALLAESPEDAGVVLGLACYYFTFSTYTARPTLYLEDLFVEEAARGRGVGTALMARLAHIALGRDCRAMEWLTPAAEDNAALPFYRGRIGAEAVETTDGGKLYRMRLPEDGLRRLAALAAGQGRRYNDSLV